jgi:uncharacterized protein (TIRG00374 family)
MVAPVRRRVNSLSNRLHYLSWPLALGLLWWVLSLLPGEQLLQAITGLSMANWLIWITLNGLIILLLAARWQVLTRAMGAVTTLGALLRVRQAGQLISFVTPGPQFGGEPLQVYWLWKRYGLPGHGAFLAVGLDRFYELWINFAVLLLAILTLAATASSASASVFDWRLPALLLLLLVGILVAAAWFLIKHPSRVEAWIEKVSRPWQNHPRLGALVSQGPEQWTQLHSALQTLIERQRPALGLALILSLLGWAGMIIELWLLLGFAGLEVDAAEFVLLFTVLRLAFLLPLPGGLGSVEAGLLLAFQALALPLSAAAGLITLMRLRDVLVLILGALLLPGLSRPRSTTSNSPATNA